MDYRLTLESRAERALRTLTAAQRSPVREAVERLRGNPRPNGAEKLKSQPGQWRIRVGDLRVIYSIDDDERLVQVLDVARRDEAYRPR